MNYIEEFTTVSEDIDENWPGMNKEGLYIKRIINRGSTICYITKAVEGKRFGDHFDYATWALEDEVLYKEAVEWLNNRSLESACKAWLEKYLLYINACELYMKGSLNF
jgi:hypothetical protein